MTKRSRVALVFFTLCFLLFSFVMYFDLIDQDKKLQNGENSDKTGADMTSAYKIEDIIGSEGKIVDSKISPDGSFALVKMEQDTKKISFGEDNEGAELVMWENISMVNLKTGEKKSFNPYSLASDQMVAFMEDAPMSQHTLYLDPVSWSEDGKSFWSIARMVSGGDPQVTSHFSIFKINTENLSVEKYPLPDGTISCNLNVKSGKVLSEALKEGNLRLFVEDIYTKKEEDLASYNNIGYKDYEYIYPELCEVEPKRMEPEWVGESTVRYVDFVTRQEITQEIK